jgi:hypothetical protein
MKYWEIVADKLSAAELVVGYCSAVTPSSRSRLSLHGFTLLSLDSRFHFTDFLFQESLRLGLARGEKLPSVDIPFLSPCAARMSV